MFADVSACACPSLRFPMISIRDFEPVSSPHPENGVNTQFLGGFLFVLNRFYSTEK